MKQNVYSVFILIFLLTTSCSTEKDLTNSQLQDSFQATTQAKLYSNYVGEKPDYTKVTIYDVLKAEGNFSNMIRLLDDTQNAVWLSSPSLENEDDHIREVVDLTLFVANDEAFTRFYSNNPWGVLRYEDFTDQQKNLLCKSAILRGAFQKHMLSKMVSSTIYDDDLNMRYPSYAFVGKGKILKQKTALSELDGLHEYTTNESIQNSIPSNSYWNALRNQNQLLLATDQNRPYQVLFLPETMTQMGIPANDLSIILSRSDASLTDFYAFNSKVIDCDIPCLNGFIHETDNVVLPTSNMAEEIRLNTQNSQVGTSIFSRLMDRFSYPVVSNSLTESYNSINNASKVVYQKKYFSKQNPKDPNGIYQSSVLNFDPGSNGSLTESNSGREIESTMRAIYAPSDDAFNDYATHEGKAIMDEYGSWDNLPQSIVAVLLNQHMKTNLSEALPSKIQQANGSFQIEKQLLSNNGVVFVTNRVLIPEAFNSVLLPTLTKNNLSIIRWAISRLYYEPILNAKEPVYSFIVPTNAALQNYIDPVSLGKSSLQCLKFYYYPNAISTNDKVLASVWTCDDAGNPIDSIGVATNNMVLNRLKDILDNYLILGDIRQCNSGITYYKTKAGGTVKVTSDGAGGYRIYNNDSPENNASVNVSNNKVFSYTNGLSLTADQLISRPKPSVFKIMETLSGTELSKGPFYEFFKLLTGCGYFTSMESNHSTADQYLSLLKSFNYTIFVPTNAAIAQAYSKGLPTLESIENETDETKKTAMLNLIRRFVRYHIQNYSIYIGQSPKTGSYNTMAVNRAKTGLLKVTTTNNLNGMTVTDYKNNERHVLVQNYGNIPLFNLMARDYLYDSSDKKKSTSIYTSAFSAIHQIDGYLDGGFTNSVGEFLLDF